MNIMKNKLVRKMLGLSEDVPANIITEKNYSLDILIREISEGIKIIANEKNLPVIIEMDKDIPLSLCGDADKIEYIIKYLLLKALNNTNSGYVKLIINGKLCDKKVKLCFKVRCTAKNIKDKDILKCKSKAEFKDICMLLKTMGSELQLNAVDDNYCEAVFYLMQDIVQEIELNTSSESIEISKDRKVLVIDDNKINVNIFKSLLKDYNVNIYAGFSGADALRMLEETKYDIVFLDHMMPELDGIETLRLHKQNKESINKDTPIIVLTANVELGAREEYMKEGFNGYLSKPIAVDNLMRIIEENCR